MSTAKHRRVGHPQNFLHNPHLVDRLLDRSGIAADDLVIEIGPGRGAITGRLAARCRQVLAVEKDPLLIEKLRGRFAGVPNVALFAGDFLDFPLPVTGYKVFANIPFNISAAIVGKLTSGTSPPVDAYLAVQRETAQRFLGEPRETLASVLLKPWFEPSVTHQFRSGDFVPSPGVEVVLLRLRKRDPPLVGPAATALFRDLAAHVFTAWQPTVRDALVIATSERMVAAVERAAGIDLRHPPSRLPFPDWLALTATFQSVVGEEAPGIRGARRRLAQQQARLSKVHRSRTSPRAQFPPARTMIASSQSSVRTADGNTAQRGQRSGRERKPKPPPS